MTALYYRDKNSGEYKKLGNGKIEEFDEISEDNDVVDERITRFFINRNETMTFTIKQPRIIDTTAREMDVEEDEENG